MDIQEKIDYWLELVDLDIDTASTLFNNKKYLYVGFFCHLIIEKTLKAYFWFTNKSEPPYKHNLNLLAERADILEMMSEEQRLFMNILIPLNIEGRYPKDKQMIFKQLTEERITDIFSKTLDLQKWIKQLIIN